MVENQLLFIEVEHQHLALIASFAKALRLAYEDLDNKYKYVLELNKYLKEKLSKNR